MTRRRNAGDAAHRRVSGALRSVVDAPGPYREDAVLVGGFVPLVYREAHPFVAVEIYERLIDPMVAAPPQRGPSNRGRARARSAWHPAAEAFRAWLASIRSRHARLEGFHRAINRAVAAQALVLFIAITPLTRRGRRRGDTS